MAQWTPSRTLSHVTASNFHNVTLELQLGNNFKMGDFLIQLTYLLSENQGKHCNICFL